MDVIYIKSTKIDEQYDICQSDYVIKINKSITIQGNALLPPLLTCSKNRYAFTVIGTIFNHVSVNISDVTFFHVTSLKGRRDCNPGEYGMILVENANINITNCMFEDVCTAIELRYNQDNFYRAHIESSEFLHVNFMIFSGRIKRGEISIKAANIVGTAKQLINGSSYAVSVSSFNMLRLKMSGSVVRQTDEGISINVREGGYRVDIESSIFAENIGQGIIGTFNKGAKTNISYFRIEKVQFLRNNGVFASAINLFSTFRAIRTHVTVDHCQFYQNEAETFFGTVYVDGVNITINNSLFINNIAGKLHGSIQGFGGAIYVEAKTEAKVFNTRFINNSCSGFGGTIFSRGDFHCTNCSFVGPGDIVVRPLLGDILYATAGLTLTNTKWIASINSEMPKPFIWHPGSPTIENWKIKIDGSFKARCPPGHNMTSSGVMRKGRDSNGRISISCNPCPVNQYSLSAGSLSFNHTNRDVIDVTQNIVQCYHCKYGGVCVKGNIRARANYYGYKTGRKNDEVHFISCPVGYCCTGDKCKKFNSCHSNRKGELCGKCKRGYSENVINANCIDTKLCKDFWFWLIYAPSGFVYILSFMYLDMISQFIKHQLIWWNEKIHHRNDLDSYEIIDVAESEDGGGSSANSSLENINKKEPLKEKGKFSSTVDQVDNISEKSPLFGSSLKGNEPAKIFQDTITIDDTSYETSTQNDPLIDNINATDTDQVDDSRYKLSSIKDDQKPALGDSFMRMTPTAPNDETLNATEKKTPTAPILSEETLETSNQSDYEIDRSNEVHAVQWMDKEVFNRTHNGVRTPDIFSDILNISFYFYQMFILLRMRESAVLTRILMGLKSLYSSIFTLSMEGHNSFIVCPLPRLHAVGKMLLVKSFTMYVLCLLTLFHIVVYCITRLLRHNNEKYELCIVFSVRLKVATIQIILIGYATLTTTTLTLLNCVPVNKKSVLLIDGSVTCYAWWQIIIFIFFIFWIVPFPIVMVNSLIHLKKDVINYRYFILAWCFPMLYLFYMLSAFLVRHLYDKDVTSSQKRKHKNEKKRNVVREEEISIREILFRLESPFKGDSKHLFDKKKKKKEDEEELSGGKSGLDKTRTKTFYHEPVFWQGAMIARRLALILVMTFINAPVSRLYCALFLCIIYLTHQVYHRPHVNEGANIYEIATSATLIIFCSMNLFFAYSYVSDITPEVSDEHLTIIFRVFEAVVLVFLPTLVAIVFILLIITRICTLMFTCVKGCVHTYITLNE